MLIAVRRAGSYVGRIGSDRRQDLFGVGFGGILCLRVLDGALLSDELRPRAACSLARPLGGMSCVSAEPPGLCPRPARTRAPWTLFLPPGALGVSRENGPRPSKLGLFLPSSGECGWYAWLGLYSLCQGASGCIFAGADTRKNLHRHACHLDCLFVYFPQFRARVACF